MTWIRILYNADPDPESKKSAWKKFLLNTKRTWKILDFCFDFSDIVIFFGGLNFCVLDSDPGGFQ